MFFVINVKNVSEKKYYVECGNNNLSMHRNDPLFRLMDGSILTDKDVMNVLPILFEKAGLSFDFTTSNMWRFGAATSLGRRKISGYLIQIYRR